MKKKGILALFVLFCILLAACGKTQRIDEQFFMSEFQQYSYPFTDKGGYLILKDTNVTERLYNEESDKRVVYTHMKNDPLFPSLLAEKKIYIAYNLHRIDSCYIDREDRVNQSVDEVVSFDVRVEDVSGSPHYALLKEIDMKAVLKKHKLQLLYLINPMKDVFAYEDKIYLKMCLNDSSEYHSYYYLTQSEFYYYYCVDDDTFFTEAELLKKFPNIGPEQPRETYIKHLSVGRDFMVYQNVSEPTTYVLYVSPENYGQFVSSGLPLFKKLLDYGEVMDSISKRNPSPVQIVLYDIQNEDELLKLFTPVQY